MFIKVLFVCFIGFVLISTSLAQIGSSLTKTGTTSAQFFENWDRSTCNWNGWCCHFNRG